MMIPPRQTPWRENLTAYLSGVAATPFAYGEHDCALFVAGAVQAMTGADPAAGVRGHYNTVKGGLKVLSEAGYRSPLEMVAGLFDPVPPALAQVGDIAILPATGAQPAMGIIVGEVIAVLRDDGLGHVPRMDAVAAYRVP